MPRQQEIAAVQGPPQTEERNSLMASAVRMNLADSRVYRKGNSWQTRAWHHYDNSGELRYAANWFANMLSRGRLRTARFETDGTPRVNDTGPAAEALDALFAGQDGQSQMLSAIGVHMTVAGECYIVGRAGSYGSQLWEIISTEEIRSNSGNWSINYEGEQPIPLTDSDIVIRVWRPHPRYKMQADSPVRSMLSVLTELEFLSRHVMAQITSRLTGAGILMLPQSMQFPPPPNGIAVNNAEAFMEVLGEAMLQPIEDPSSPAAVVPLVVTAPDDAIDKAKHMTFWSDLDTHAIELRGEAIRRLALGLDCPPEILLGAEKMNHWSAWQMDESAIKAHIEPMLELVANAIKVGYIQPLTEDPLDLVVFDTSSLRLRPNRSKEALELFDRGELSGVALRRETGFDENDMPQPEEFREWLLRKVASGSTTPEQVADALRELGVLGISGDSGNTPTQERPTPSLVDHPTQGPPEQDDPSQAASLSAMSEVLVYRALERAGNRLRSLKQTRPPCAAVDTYLFVQTTPGELDKVLDDAWSCVPRVLRSYPDFTRTVIVKALDAYTRTLLIDQKEHNRDEMQRFLSTTTMKTLP